MSLTRILALSFCLACWQLPAAQAGVMTLNEFDSGEIVYQDFGCFFPGSDSSTHSAGLDEIAFQLAGCGILGTSVITDRWGYLVFDLASVSPVVSSASVAFNISGLSGVGGTLQLYDYTLTSALNLANLAEGIVPLAFGADLHADFSSGNLLGSVDLNAASSPGIYDLALSSYALDQINATGGLLAMGVSYSLDFTGAVFNESISIRRPTQLRLEFADAPAPATIALLLTACAGLGLTRQRPQPGRWKPHILWPSGSRK